MNIRSFIVLGILIILLTAIQALIGVAGIKIGPKSGSKNMNVVATSTDNLQQMVFIKRNTSKIATTSDATGTDDSRQIGIISTSTDGKRLVYTNNEYGLQFELPDGWYIGDNEPSFVRLYNFKYDKYRESYGRDFWKQFNKIEIGIINADMYDPGPSDIYPGLSRQETNVDINGQIAVRTATDYRDGKGLYYRVSLPSDGDKIFVLNMYGNPSNFYILDEIISTIKWLR